MRLSHASVMWPPYIISPKIYRISSQGTTGFDSMYVCNTFAQIVRSPVLNEYLRLHPCWPNRLLPNTIEWNQHRENRHALNSVFFVHPSIRLSEKFAHPLVRLDLVSVGAWLATFMDPCIRLSGMLVQVATGGGSADMKHLKAGWAPSCTTSKSLSREGTQDCIK